MPQPKGPPDDGGEHAITGLDDLFAEALAGWEKIEKKAHDTEPEPVEDLLLEDDDEDGLDEGSIVLELDTAELSAADELASIEDDARDAEIEALADRVAQLEEVVDKAKVAHRTISEKLDNANRERLRQTQLARRAQERIRQLEQHRQTLLDERDDAIQRAQRTESALTVSQRESTGLRARMRREQDELRRSGHTAVLKELLPPLDNLELALQHTSGDPAQVVQGVQMIVHQFHQALERVGLQRIAPEPGEAFDPEIHEAILEEQFSPYPAGRIHLLHVCGYRIDQRLVRPAKVVISSVVDHPGMETAEEPDPAEQHGEADSAGAASAGNAPVARADEVAEGADEHEANEQVEP